MRVHLHSLVLGGVALAACVSIVGTAPPRFASTLPPFHLCAQIESELG
jgi:hypothetical protein